MMVGMKSVEGLAVMMGMGSPRWREECMLGIGVQGACCSSDGNGKVKRCRGGDSDEIGGVKRAGVAIVIGIEKAKMGE